MACRPGAPAWGRCPARSWPGAGWPAPPCPPPPSTAGPTAPSAAGRSTSMPAASPAASRSWNAPSPPSSPTRSPSSAACPRRRARSSLRSRSSSPAAPTAPSAPSTIPPPPGWPAMATPRPSRATSRSAIGANSPPWCRTSPSACCTRWRMPTRTGDRRSTPPSCRLRRMPRPAASTEGHPSPRHRAVQAYALSNEHEYFAELSEAYFGVNDFFPSTATSSGATTRTASA